MEFLPRPVGDTDFYADAAPAPAGVGSHVTTYEYEYDPAGHVSKLYHTFDSDPRVLMADYRYDEVGRLETKLIYNHTDTASYKYNVRGWPTEINEPGMKEKIYYNEDLPQGVAPLYNGNIPCLSNSVNGEVVARFTYDDLNRLLSTRRYKMDGTPTEDFENFSYDKMGNLLNYERAFHDPYYPGYLNLLSIVYQGNQIKSATDNCQSMGFHYYNLRYPNDRNDEVEYFYDSNGNLVKNLDNRIGKIKNNILNLPEVVVFIDGNLLTFSYMADGRKVRDSYGSYPTKPTTPLDTVINNTDPYITGINDWSEDYYYAAGKLRRVTTLDGYLNLYNRTGYRNYYAVKDHIGCTWEYEIGSKKSVGHPSYYPSGIMDRKPYTTYPFGLGGKEFMSTNYLDEYFFDARTMYAIMNRFNQVDPLCEEYYSVSPYVYALNNPVRYKDPTGKYVESAWDIFSLVTGANSFVGNVRAGNVGAAVIDGLGVVVDVAAVILPGIPGGAGAAAKGVRALDKATDAVKAVDKTSAAKKTYQTYTKINRQTGEVYTGRTSGKGSPEQNVKKRDRNHHKNKEGFGAAKIDKTSSNPDAIRGREQQMIDKNGGAKSQGGTSGNTINGVSPTNPKLDQYLEEAKKQFGIP